ncbi:hypothetical protein SPBR_00625 [Sporothrix brasiliensis 5110]|uniref:BHLH domain-containing protein n=1 Tax=Sporothrix brasiliensis 5110 TaxID=1398154 RepID=A0A0C2EVS9_9PEZI|nr:uncharacterized protein SPBR_00625 [Sporothrix brasiliensis 5110]KIH90639.1 hypothetical protein SPBR_00625 [Sporothrix brasiliensis 5110]
MNNEQQSNASEQYFAPIGGEGQIPTPDDVAMIDSGGIHEGMFSFPADIQLEMESDAHSRAGHDWRQSGHHMAFASPVSATSPADASLSSYGYIPYGEQCTGAPVEAEPTLFERGYAPSSNRDDAVPYSSDWNAHDTPSGQDSDHGAASSWSGTGHGSARMSPVDLRPGAKTPNSFTSTSSGGRYSTTHTGIADINAQRGASVGSGSIATPEKGHEGHSPANKKGKAKQKPPQSRRPNSKAGAVPAPSALSMASSSGGESLSSGDPSSRRAPQSSTTSRNVEPPAEKQSRKRSRGAQNIMERQYRNRLNARFEDLMNALPPESLRSPATVFGYSSATAVTANAVERQASKGEVLELARKHIQRLEQQRDDLKRERDELQDTSQRLQKIYASRSSEHGQTSETGTEHDEDDEDNEDDEDDGEEDDGV